MAVFKNNVPLVTNGLILYHDPANFKSFPSGSNVVYDLSGGENNGTLSSVTSSADRGGAFVFSSGTGQINIPTCSDAFNTQDFTITTVVQNALLSNNGCFLEKGITNTQYMFFPEGDLIKLRLNSGNDVTYQTINIPIYNSAGNFNPTVLTVSYNGTTKQVKHYINRDLVKTSTVGISSINTSINKVTIGKLESAPYNFSGSMYKMIMYNRELTLPEIIQNYQVISPRYTAKLITPTASLVSSNLIMHLDANNPSSYPGTGTTWTDLTGNGYNFTLTNNPTWVNQNGAYAISFNGSNYCFRTGSLNHDISTECTVNVVIANGGSGGRLFSMNKLIGVNDDYINFFAFVDTLFIILKNNQINLAYGDLTKSNYKVLTVTWNNTANTSRIYINSILVGSSTATAFTYTDIQRMAIGANAGTLGEQSTCKVGALQIYNRQLSATEVRQNYDALKTTYGLT